MSRDFPKFDGDHDSRIAILLPRREIFGPAGAGAVSIIVRSICRHSIWRGRVTVLGSAVEEPYHDISFVPVGADPWVWGRRTSRYVAGAMRILQRIRPRIIEIHNRPQYVASVRRNFPESRLVLYLHNDLSGMKGFAEPEVRGRLLGRLSAVICVSGFIRDRVLSGIVGSRLHDRVHVVLNGIDVKNIAMIPPEEKRREIVFAGRLTPEKGSPLFVEAAARVLPGFPEWRGVLIGTRDLRGHRRITAFERHVIDRFNMLDGQSEVAGYLTHDRVMDRFRNAAIAVVPSLWDEPCGMVAIEAMASGCAVVTTPRGGLPEVLGDAGIMLESETSDALARAFAALICDDSRRHELQRRARERAVEKLDIRRVCAQLDQLRCRLIDATAEA